MADGDARREAGPGGPRTGRHAQQGENRWPPAVAAAVAIVTYAFLPESLLPLPRYLIPGVEALLLVALVVTNPLRMARQSRRSRWLSIGLALVVVLANLTALGYLVSTLRSDAPGGQMLVASLQVWITNVIGFGLLYWEIDRGGPVCRRLEPRTTVPLADWRFSHDENRETVGEVADGASSESNWMPQFVDYLYLSLTNSSAFSPTDTMPLSTRAKALMGTQATAALLTSLLVVARAVGALGG